MNHSFTLSFLLLSSWIFGQNAPTANTPIFSHQYTTLNQEKYTFLDTNLNHLQTYHIWNFTQKDDFGYARLGNIGAAMNPLVYQNNRDILRPFSLWGYEPYVFPLEDLPLYYVRSPLTEARYRMGYGRGQQFSIFHTQNVNRYWNAQIAYQRLNSNGIYNNAETEGARFYLTSAYDNSETGLKVTSIYLQDRITSGENGGLAFDSTFTENIFEQRDVEPIQLNQASRTFRRRTLYNDMSYNFLALFQKEADTTFADSVAPKGNALRFGLKSRLEEYKVNYSDNNSGDFYEDNFFDATNTNDSLYFTNLRNTAYLETQIGQESQFQLLAGITHAYMVYSGASFHSSGNTFGIDASLKGTIKEYVSLEADLQYAFAGTLSESLDFRSKAKLKIFKSIKAEGGYAIQVIYPDVKHQFYRSNHFIWSNNFSHETHNHLFYGLSWKGGSATFHNRFINNYVYFDADARPAQNNALVNINQLELKQDFTLWNFLHLDNRFVYQSTNEAAAVLPLPELVGRHALYFEFSLFKKELKCLLGSEVNYFSQYDSPSYMPATGGFYVANQNAIGDYPIIDVFANFQLKKARFYLKYEHVNSGFMGYRYFAAPSHPFPDRIFRVGIDWRFFN